MYMHSECVINKEEKDNNERQILYNSSPLAGSSDIGTEQFSSVTLLKYSLICKQNTNEWKENIQKYSIQFYNDNCKGLIHLKSMFYILVIE